MRRRHRSGLLILGIVAAAGCTNLTDRGPWGVGIDWPSGQRLGDAALEAVKDPQVWVPLAGAAVIGVGGWDDDISDWAVEETPLFGDDAADVSDHLKSFNSGVWLTTAVLAPSEGLVGRAQGLLVQGATLVIEEGSVNGLKSLTSRERPDGRDDKSFPSGHTSRASVTAGLAATNLEYFAMPDWARATLQIGLYGTAAATGWARVEAERHYPTDVLVGYAIGQFLARFMHKTFFNDQGNNQPDVAIHFAPTKDGGALMLQWAVP